MSMPAETIGAPVRRCQRGEKRRGRFAFSQSARDRACQGARKIHAIHIVVRQKPAGEVQSGYRRCLAGNACQIHINPIA